MITVHGGTLTERHVDVAQEQALLAKAKISIAVDAVAEADLEMLGIGGYSPLGGFMTYAEQQSVVTKMHLVSGVMWPIPITLGIESPVAKTLTQGDFCRLVDDQGLTLGVIEAHEIYERDLQQEIQAVFGTTDAKHPGAAQVLSRGPWCVGGPVHVFVGKKTPTFSDRRLTPRESRQVFEKNGWRRIVGFQTRNPIHRAHEYIVKCALEISDGLFLHPLVGFTKSDDIPADVRMACYEALINHVMPKDRVVLSVLPAPMRYAGPKEALLHAIMRQNYGCTHFIVGRDHAGVGNYYGTYDAQKIFGTLTPGDLAIVPLCFENSFFCKACGQMGTSKTCPHATDQHVSLSGTKVRELLKNGERPPVEFSRPQVADILIQWAKNA